jgi:hypothetical protein
MAKINKIAKADGTHATVLLDENFTVTETQDQGGRGGRGHSQSGAPPRTAPASTASPPGRPGQSSTAPAGSEAPAGVGP